jgi:alkaline phosphatase D
MRFPAAPFSPSRRRLLRSTVSLAAAAVWAGRAEGPLRADVPLAGDPFALGVASGDPTAEGFVIWSRLAPRPIEPDGGMPAEAVAVRYEVAEDEGFTRIIRQGSTTATPDWAHSVHVEVTGLAPDRPFFYRFHCAGATSPVGRARTFPAAGAAPGSLRFAFASCQHYEQGFFTAYGQMVADDPALILHLGDYIYEQATRGQPVRDQHGGDALSLADYRRRHAVYKTDEHLQAAHRHCPWIVTWDDHEVANDYWGGHSSDPAVSPEAFAARRAAGYQAYYEHLPLRRAHLPHGAGMPLHRRVSFGSLAEFFVLDTRQHRTQQPCGNGNRQPCDGVLDEAATLTGPEQERWLLDGFAASSSTWNILAQQVMMARVDRSPGPVEAFSMDQWPGYERQRRRILAAFAARPAANPLVLTGDIHSHWANDLVAAEGDAAGRVVGTELVTTSISSGGNGTAAPAGLAALHSENPFVKFHNAQRGYVACDLTPTRCLATFRVVDVVTRPGGAVSTAATFAVESGRPGLHTA